MAAKGSQPQLPAWVWLFTGVVTGLFAAFLIYLANLQSPIPTERPPKAAVAAEKPVKPVETGGPAKSTPESPRKFDFYTILPEAETLGAPEDEPAATPPAGTATATPAGGVATSGTATPPASADTAAQAAPRPTQKFFLQTGSFPGSGEADKLRAQLLLLGIPTSVQKVELEPGKVWHRVQAGPFPDKASLTAAQQKLAAARIQAIVVRPKTP